MATFRCGALFMSCQRRINVNYMLINQIRRLLSPLILRSIQTYAMAGMTRSKSRLPNSESSTIDLKSSESVLTLDFQRKDNKSRMPVVNKRKHLNADVQVKFENDSSIKQDPEETIIKVKQEPVTPPKKQRKHIKVEYEDTSYDNKGVLKISKLNVELDTSPKMERKHVKVVKQEKSDWRPPHWEEMLSNIRQMRSAEVAPVDNMGCHVCHDETAPPHIMRYQNLIALMLSSQTKDQVTYAAMQRLKSHGLTIENILDTSDEELGKLIYPVGFWKTKVKYIKKTTQTLKDEYNGDIPNTVEDLCRLTGVGPKMAHICMSVAWNQVTGIGVDTHVHRISNRIGWLPKVTKTPEATRELLQSWLPFDLWSEVNHLLVGFGQTICSPIKPHCESCLSNNICPYGKKQIK